MEERLLRILKLHKGREYPITAKDLAKILGEPDDRHIRTGIRQLIAWGVPIASSTKIPYGYYIVETIKEADEYGQSLRGRLIEDALRRRDFRRAVAKSFGDGGQLQMF